MKQTGLLLGSMVLGVVIFAFAVATSREQQGKAGSPSADAQTLGSRAGLWLSYLIGLFLVVQGAVGLLRLR